jgi:hypothetical protein
MGLRGAMRPERHRSQEQVARKVCLLVHRHYTKLQAAKRSRMLEAWKLLVVRLQAQAPGGPMELLVECTPCNAPLGTSISSRTGKEHFIVNEMEGIIK